MILLRDSTPLPPEALHAVVALGNFDGLHLGHKAVIEKAVGLANAVGKPSMVMTFEPHPRRVFRPDLPPLRILPLREKLRLAERMGVDFLRIVRFSKGFSETTPEDFVHGMLRDRLHVSHVVTGEDFVFGHKREGDAAALKAIAAASGFAASVCPPVEVAGERCSSTRIRAALAAGDMKLAAALLGRPYTIGGHVREGDRRGRTLGFPTANLFPPPTFLPSYGVYAVKATVGGREARGVANLGLRPTFGGTRVRLEVHLFDWQQDIYGERMEVELAHFIRGERKFDGLDALTSQIAEDCMVAKALLLPL